MAEATLNFTIRGTDQGSAVLRGLQNELAKTKRLMDDLSKSFQKAALEPTTLARNASRSLRAGLLDAEGILRARRGLATAETKAMQDGFKDWQTRSRLKAASLKAERKDVERTARDMRTSFAKPIDLAKTFTGLDDVAAKIDGLAGKVARAAEGMRALGEAASAVRVPDLDPAPFRASRSRGRGRTTLSDAEREVTGGYGSIVRRHQRFAEREAVRKYREEQRDVADRKRRTHRAFRRVDRTSRNLASPIVSTPLIGALLSLTGAVTGLRSSIEAARTVDDATTRLRMFGPGISAADAAGMRSQALKDSITLGTAPEHLLNVQSEALRAAVPPAVARAMSSMIPQAAAAMGETAEKLADSMGEALQQLVGMGAVKGPDDARRFINDAAGLSNFGGMDPRKMNEFLASGGLGHGRELGLDPADTLGLAAAFGAMGARTGMYDARMLGQFSQVVPKMHDRWSKADRSHIPSDTSDAVKGAPKMLGYGDIDAMAKAVESGADGLLDFIQRLGKLDAKTRKLVLQGYGFSESTGAVVGDIASSPGKAQSFLKQARDLDRQKAGTDYLTAKWNEWRTSLSFMVQQIAAGFEAIKAELGDVLKVDLIGPFRDFWTDLSRDLLDGGIRDRFHRDLLAFINGLGFQDAAEMFRTLRGSLKGFDAAEFFRGVGEGLRSVFDAARTLFHGLAAFTGGTDPETIGRLGVELFGLALGVHAIGPVLGTFAAVVATMRAFYDVGQLGLKVAEWSGMTKVLTTLVKLPFLEAAAGLAALLGPLTTLVGLAGYASSKGMLAAPGGFDVRSILRFLDPALADHLLGAPGDHPGKDKDDVVKSDTGSSRFRWGRDPLLQRQSYGGDDFKGLLQRTAFIDESGPVGRAITSTDQTVAALLAEARKAHNLVNVASIGTGRSSFDVGGSMGASTRSPGSWVSYLKAGHASGPLGAPAGSSITTPLGPTGARFAGKAPGIMRGLMARYGLTKAQAAGVVGNLAHESAGFTAYQEGGQAPGKGGVGWAQWTGSRRRMFEAWTAAHGLNPTSDQASWRYLTEGDPETAKAIAAVKRQSTVGGAMRAFEGAFERAGVKGYKSRQGFADKAMGMDLGSAPDATTPSQSVARSIPVNPGRHAGAHHSGPVTIHVNGAGDPATVARMVHREFSNSLQYRAHDVSV